VLYLHGYVDYFFQTHLAEFFTARGYDFYALDLRKYGRSLRSHQTPNFCRDIAEYYPEIDRALKIIRDDDGTTPSCSTAIRPADSSRRSTPTGFVVEA
jgi:alpha-beta hydrolase superfamily lysophospholipase